MADVFISYAREDAAQAEQLARALEAAGYTSWWDRNLVSGSRYLAETEAQLKGSKAVVVIWSKVSVTSHWVADEAAVGRDESRLAALSFDGSMPPLGFRQFQVTDFTGWQGDEAAAAFRNLIAGLERLVPRGAAQAPAPAAAPSTHAPAVRGNLPLRQEALIGRGAELGQIGDLLQVASLVTLTGPGGVGKTRLAIEAARRAAPDYRDGARLVELALVSDPGAVPQAIAATLGIAVDGGRAEGLADRLVDWNVLLVLDNCEHLVEAAAALIDQILQRASAVRILATSQEILGVDGERVVRLRSLGEVDAASLFLRRAQAVDGDFRPSAAEITRIAEICAGLDGIPLAIEMAAAHAPALGCEALKARLDDRFRILTGGRRTALPRQRTLLATLDWSHGLLLPAEATVFRRLAVFCGGCTLEAASAVASDEGIDAITVSQALAVLARKSLVVVDRSTGVARYKLLETMRAYAQQKLVEAAETDAVSRRHARFFSQFVASSTDNWYGNMSDQKFFDHYVADADNVASAIAWGFGPGGDRLEAASLVARSPFVFLARGRLTDVVPWLREALAVPGIPTKDHDRLVSALLHIALQVGGAAAYAEACASVRLPEPDGDTMARFQYCIAGFLAAFEENSPAASSFVAEAERLVLPGTRGAAWVEYMRAYLLIRREDPQDTEVIRQLSDRVVAGARAIGARMLEYLVFALLSPSEAPREDPDRAIESLASLVSGLEELWPRTSPTVSLTLLSRYVILLCQRSRPGDVERAIQSLRLANQRIAGAHVMPLFSVALAWVAVSRGLTPDAALILGKIGRISGQEAGRLPTVDFFLSPLKEQLVQALGEQAYRDAIRAGAALSIDDAYRLAVGEGGSVA